MQCHTSSASFRMSTPQISEASMNMPQEIWMMRRLSKRSASAPNGIEKNRCGTQWLTTAKPASRGDSNSCHMTQ